MKKILKATVVLSLALLLSHPHLAQATGAPDYLPDGSHPRLFLTPQTLTTLKGKMVANDPDWVALKARADALATYTVPPYSQTLTANNTIYYSYEGSSWLEAIQVLGLAYQISGNQGYAAKLKELIDVMNASGLAPMTVDSGYPSRNIAFGMALAYDWLYDYLDSATKASMITTINAWYDWYSTKAYQASDTTGTSNYFGGHILGFGLCGYATYGENSRAQEIYQAIRGKWDGSVAPAFTSGAMAGGYPIESYSYGGPNLQRLLQYAQGTLTSTGEDIASDFGSRVATALYYNMKPNRWQASDEGDYGGSYTGVMFASLPLFLSSMLPGSDGDQMAFYYTNFAATPLTSATTKVQAATPFERVLFNIPRNAADYRSVQPLAYRSTGDEHVYSRSDWTDGAIWVSFNGGSTHYANHQALSAGHINMQRGGDYLLVSAGQWKGCSGLTGSPSNYKNASVAMNTLYFYDGGAYTRTDSALFEGGQEYYGSSNVLNYEATDRYVYEKADLTSAYYASTSKYPISARTLTYFYRNFVSLPGLGAVVFDRTHSTQASYQKKLFWYLNAQSTPVVAGSLVTADVGSSRLHVQTVFPASAAVSLVTNPSTTLNGVLYGQRLEVDGGANNDFNPLTVLLATSNGTATPAITGIDTGSMQGALIAAATPQVVIFSKDGSPQSAVSYVAEYPSTQNGSHLVLDLAPGQYDVFRDGSKILTGVQASDQGVLSFTADGGTSFSVSQSNNDLTPPTASVSSPLGGSMATGTITVSADASDNIGVTKVEFYVNGQLQSTSTAAPYSFSWNTLPLANGPYTLACKAYDAAGNVGQSSGVTVNVFNDTTPPLVTSFGLPATATSLTVPVTLAATDNVAVTGYLVSDSPALPTADDSRWTAAAPVSFAFSGYGAHTAYAWAKDAAANVSATASATVTINDATPPVLTAFAMPASATNLTVPISSLAATDNVGVAGYLISESSSAPAAFDSRWTSATPTSFTFAGYGARTAYAWAKDAAGNVSATLSAAVTINDVVAPTVTSFSMPASASTLTVPVSAFSATDNVAVTAYLITETATAPAASATGWTASAPTSFTFAGEGNRTAYAWAKDAAGNVSAAAAANVSVALADTIAPAITAFTMPDSASSTKVAVTSFTASDNKGVTGYLITESATSPSPTAAGWLASAPTSFTFAGNGSRTAYAWAKDAAGNVSAASSQTVFIDNIAPVVSSFSVLTSGAKLTINAAATDNVAVTRMQLYLNNSLALDTSANSLYYVWNSVPKGTNTITVKAYDAVGNSVSKTLSMTR